MAAPVITFAVSTTVQVTFTVDGGTVSSLSDALTFPDRATFQAPTNPQLRQLMQDRFTAYKANLLAVKPPPTHADRVAMRTALQQQQQSDIQTHLDVVNAAIATRG